MNSSLAVSDIENMSYQLRRDVLESLAEAGSGHLGGSLGLADVFAALYFSVLNHDPANPRWEKRDRFVLSIGHVAPIYYATLARAGYFPVEELRTLRKLGSRLQGHPGLDSQLPGLESSAGSLGQGLSIAVGMALTAKMDNANWRTYCLMGDGELQEGAVWEAAMSAHHYELDNLIAIVDRNNVQIDGETEDVMKLEPLKQKFEAFGWHTIQCDGNSIPAILHAFEKAHRCTGQPVVILAKTHMGAGISSIEDDYSWHGKAPDAQQLKGFLQELAENKMQNINGDC